MADDEQGRDAHLQPPTTLYVVIPPSALFAAHWSFFIPDTLGYDPVTKRYEESKQGRRIHATGDRLNGFKLEIVRDYDVAKHRSVGTRRFAVGLIPHKHLHPLRTRASEHAKASRKDEDEGGGYVDNEPLDAFEKTCTEAEMPGPSLTSAQSNGRRLKTEVKDCQWWIRRVIEALSDRGMIDPLPSKDEVKDPNAIVTTLPVH
jgi:hypothetical protein